MDRDCSIYRIIYLSWTIKEKKSISENPSMYMHYVHNAYIGHTLIVEVLCRDL